MNRRKFIQLGLTNGLIGLIAGCSGRFTVVRSIEDKARILDGHKMMREDEGTIAENIEVIASVENISEEVLSIGMSCNFLGDSGEVLSSTGSLALNVEPAKTVEFTFQPVDEYGVLLVGDEVRDIVDYKLELLSEDEFCSRSDRYC